MGVFLKALERGLGYKRLPHARGGVSHSELGYRISRVSSPRTWGCFYPPEYYFPVYEVFPTHVGVFLVDKAQLDT